jgi:hypothetical protein
LLAFWRGLESRRNANAAFEQGYPINNKIMGLDHLSQLAILAVPFATNTCIMLAVKKLAGYSAVGNGPEAKPRLRAILVVLALIGDHPNGACRSTRTRPRTLLMTLIQVAFSPICRTRSTTRFSGALRNFLGLGIKQKPRYLRSFEQ